MYVKAKSLISSRSFWLAVAQGLIGIYVAATTQYPDLATVGWVAIVKSILDVYLRYTTTTPVASVLSGGSVHVDQ